MLYDCSPSTMFAPSFTVFHIFELFSHILNNFRLVSILYIVIATLIILQHCHHHSLSLSERPLLQHCTHTSFQHPQLPPAFSISSASFSFSGCPSLPLLIEEPRPNVLHTIFKVPELAPTPLREPTIHDEMLVSEYWHSPVLHSHNIDESIVGADTRKAFIEEPASMSPAPSSYEMDRLISDAGAAGIPPPPQIALLKVKDVDGKYIDIPLYERPSWPELCSFLVAKQVLAKGHLSSGDCVVYTQDGQVLFDQEWDNWIADAISPHSEDITPTQLQVELRIVRKSCCEKLSEQDQDVCNGCSTPLIDMDLPFLNPPDAMELVPIPSTPHIEMTNNVVPDESHPIATSVEITFNSENALVRRRKQQPSSEESGEGQRSSPLQNEDQNMDSRNNTLHRVVDVLWILYLYLIRPPLIALPCTLNERFHREKLDFHLSFLQTWILGIDVCLLGGAWAVSDLTTASQSPVLQTFVQLSASFAFFGIVFGLLLSYNIGMMKEKDLFVQWVNQNRGNRASESRVSVWDPIIMLNLPLTWTAWAILNTVVFVLLYAWIIDPSGGSSIATNIPGAFTSFVIGWSVFYVYMIQREISRCRLYPREEVV